MFGLSDMLDLPSTGLYTLKVMCDHTGARLAVAKAKDSSVSETRVVS
jgi:hypothetical protein